MIKLKDLIKENDADYKWDHTAPDPEAAAPLYDLTINEIYPKDVYETLWHYKTHEIHDGNSLYEIQRCHNRPRAGVAIFRAVPLDVKKINEGDWVTITRSYAKEHIEGNPGQKMKILRMVVRARDVWNDGGSIHEWGYVKNTDPSLIGHRNAISEHRRSIYRGVSQVNKKYNSFYTTNREWARQFTQSGLDHEIKKAYIDMDVIYRAEPMTRATSDKDFDRDLPIAKAKGFKALWVNEGPNQPSSIYVFDSTAFI